MDPELEVRAVAGRYLAAVVAGDPVRTISLMSPKAQAELLHAARREGYAAETALDAATEWFARWRAVFAVFAEDEIDVVDVVGDDATATHRRPDDENRDPDDVFVLRRIDGEWRIDAFPDDEDDDPGGPRPA
jgi:hypothetical protein